MKDSRYFVAGLTMLTAALAAGDLGAQETAPPPASPPARHGVTSENRLFLRFVEDAAVVPSYWLEGQGRFQSNIGMGSLPGGDADVLSIAPIFAMNVAEDLELGARIALAFRDAADDGSASGLTDLDLWGKMAIVTDPVRISAGLMITAPTGDEDRLLGTGETNVEFFAGLRSDYTHVTLAANLGMRVNQDAEFDGVPVEGKNSFLAGGAMMFPVTDQLVLTAELAFESERFEGLDNDTRLIGGFEYRRNESILYRGGIGGGLSDGAPDFELIGGAVWIF